MNEGKTLKGRYTIIQDLRRGAFGKTYLAEDKQASNNSIVDEAKFNNLCVVKQLQPSSNSGLILEEARNRFQLEAATLEKLGDRDCIPRLLDRFEEDREFYLVQEFIDGQDLTQEIREGKRFTEAQAIAFLYDTLEVLEYIHEHNVIHRDIKPSNLIRRKSDDKIVVVDFGAVKEIETLVLSSEGQPSGSVVGTPGYMPIEHLGGRPRFNSDIYALGMTAIQALTGMAPLDLPPHPQTDEVVWRDIESRHFSLNGASAFDVARQQRPEMGKNGKVSDELAEIIDKMVRSQHRERYQSAREVLDDLLPLYKELQSYQKIGELLNNRYKVIRLLAEAEYSKTYLVSDQQRADKLKCVVKQIKLQSEHKLVLEEARRLFEVQAQIIYNLGKHYEIPSILGEFEEENEFFLVQEYIDGDRLSEEIARGKFNEFQAMELLRYVLKILKIVHQETLHLDIKPSNLIRRKSDGKFVLIDFACVKQISFLTVLFDSGDRPEFSFSEPVGTPGYMPEEQKTKNPTPSNDLYALGMTIIHALTGVFPTELGIDSKTGEIGWRDLTRVSDIFAAIIDKMVHSYFRARYQSAEEVIQDLHQIYSRRKILGIEDFSALSTSEDGSKTHLESEAIGLVESDFSEYSLVGQGESTYSYEEALNHGVVSDRPGSVNGKSGTITNTKSPLWRGGLSGEKDVASDRKVEVFSDATLPARSTTPKRRKTISNSYRLLPFSLVFMTITLAILGVFVWSEIQFAYYVEECNKLIDAEQPETAESFCERAKQIKPNNPEVLKNEGDALFDLERFDAALISYDRAIEENPRFDLAWNARGKVLYKLQRYQEALESYQQAIAIAPSDPKGFNGRGIALIGLGRFEEALAAFEEAISRNPKEAGSWENKALALQYLKRDRESQAAYKEALVILEKRLKDNPEDLRAWVDRGGILVKLQRHQEALDSYDKAIAIEDNFYRAWIGKGITLFFLQRYQEALEAYDRAVESRPEYYLAWHNRGSFLADGFQLYDEAINSYQKAIDLNPIFDAARRDLGMVLMKSDRNMEAFAAFNKAIEVNPHNFQFWVGRGMALTKLKRYDEALVNFDKALSINPEDAIAWANKGWALREMQRYQEALVAYDRAIAIKPNLQTAIGERQQVIELLKK